MTSMLRNSLNYMDNLGFINVFIPFIFVFVVIFGILEKTKVLGIESNGKSKKNINSMVAFVISFLFISSTTRVESLTVYLQIIAMVIVLLMGLAYGFALFQTDLTYVNFRFKYLLLLLFVLVASLYSLGLLNNLEYDFIFDLIFNPVVITVVCFIGIVMFITSGDVGSVAGDLKNNKGSSGKNSRDSSLRGSSFENMDNVDILKPKYIGNGPVLKK